MKKKLLLSILTSMSLLSGLIGSNNSLIKESATDGLAINETSVALKGRKFINRNSLDSKENNATLLASRMGVQAGTNQKGEQCMRFVVAVPHLNVNVSFFRTLTKEDGTATTKTIVATVAYTAIKVNDSVMELDSSANDVFNTTLEDGTTTAYKYFVCYTMAGFTEELATLAVNAEITDLSEENNLGTTTKYNIANIAGVEGTFDVNDTTSATITLNGVNYTLSDDKTYYIAKTIAATEVDALYQEEYEIVPYIIHGQGLVASSFIPVKKIDSRCFSNSYLGAGSKYNLVTKRIVLPSTITEIGQDAFCGMENLVSINLPDSIEIIGVSAFDGCSALKGTIELPLNLKTIEKKAFSNCSNVERFVLKDNVTTIEQHAFYNCTSLMDINLPNSITSIKGRAFYCCKKLTSIKLPKNESFTVLPNELFRNCALKSIEIPNTIKMIDDNVFRAPDITDSDYEGGVYNALESITFEEGSQLNTIKGNVFRSQHNLKSIVLPDTLVSIGNAFGGCTNLTSINIPRDLTTFGDSTYNPIRLCTSLKEITIDPNNTNFKVIGEGLYSADETVLWGHAHGNTNTEFVIPHSVKEIVGQAFWGSKNITTLKYNGTKEEWNTIKLGGSWNSECNFNSVECLDGTITL